MFAMVEHTQ